MVEIMKIVVLGTTAALPTKNSPTTSFALKYGGVYMFDACEGVQQQMMKFGVSPSKVQVVFLSHLHADHFLGLLGFVQSQNLMARREQLLIVGPKGTKDFFEAIFSNKQLSAQFPIKYKEATRETKVFENDLFAVTAFPVKHAGAALGYAVECHSYRRYQEDKARAAGIRGILFTILAEKKEVVVDGKKVKYDDVTYLQEGKKFVYSGDTMPCPSVVQHAQGADLLIHESTFGEDQKDIAAEKRHSTAGQAAHQAKKAKAKKLLLIHISNRYEDRKVLLEEAAKVFPETLLAAEGLEIEV